MKRFSILLPLVLLASIAFAQNVFAQDDAIAPADNLVTEGIPKIPSAVVGAVGRYSEFRTAAFGSWNPTKREMLIHTRFGDTSQVHLVKFPGGARNQLTFFPDRVAQADYQPATGQSFLFSKDTGGAEFFQIYRYDLATGNITLLTDGKSRNTSPHWSHQGDRIAVRSRPAGERVAEGEARADPRPRRAGCGVGPRQTAWPALEPPPRRPRPDRRRIRHGRQDVQGTH